MVIHRVFSASSFFFLLHLSLQDLSHNAWEGSSESKQESGVYKKKIPVPFAPGPVPYSKSNEEKEKKIFPVHVSSEPVSLPGSAGIRIKN